MKRLGAAATLVQGGVRLSGGKVSGVRGLGIDSGRFVVLEELVLGNERGSSIVL